MEESVFYNLSQDETLGGDSPSIHKIPSQAALKAYIDSKGGGGRPSVPAKDVNFYDYDGTRLYAYTKAEALALTAVPALPDNTEKNLTCDGWNWSLANLQTYVTANGKLDVGAYYHTTDGKTHIKIELIDNLDVALQIQATVANAVTIDWGDGVTDTVTGNSSTRMPHTYSARGKYDIAIACSSGTYNFPSSIGGNMMGLRPDGTAWSNVANFNNNITLNAVDIYMSSSVTSLGGNCFTNCHSLQSVTIPSSVTSLVSSCFTNCSSLQSVTIPSSVTSLGGNCFTGCSSLRSVTIPSSVTSLGGNCFTNCSSLRSVTIPSSVTSLGSSCFMNCYSLQSVTIPSSVTSVGSSCFSYCYSLQSVTIPSSVTSLGGNCFSNCYSLATYHCQGATPPTLAAANAIYVQTEVVIYVPTGHLTDYQTAQYWSGYSSYMVEE